jgi:flagellar motor switch protein FliG
LEVYIGGKKAIVVTSYGHEKTIDRIAVSTFEMSDSGYYDSQESDARKYCDTINSLELKGDNWVFAIQISENTQYDLDELLPLKFSDIIIKLDNATVQMILRKIDSQDLSRSLIDQDETVKEKIFANMSKRASKMLKEDMEFKRKLQTKDIRESQAKIVNMIRRWDQRGEICVAGIA